MIHRWYFKLKTCALSFQNQTSFPHAYLWNDVRDSHFFSLLKQVIYYPSAIKVWRKVIKWNIFAQMSLKGYRNRQNHVGNIESNKEILCHALPIQLQGFYRSLLVCIVHMAFTVSLSLKSSEIQNFLLRFPPSHSPSPLNSTLKVSAKATLIHLSRKEPVFQYGHDATARS